MSTVWDTTNKDVAEVMSWCIANGVAVDLQGTCGFGRECVGLIRSGHYLSYEWGTGDNDPVPTTVEDAYHKSDCTAVLGRGENAERQLLAWGLHLARNGWAVEIEQNHHDNAISALLHGPVTPRLVKAVQS